MPDCGSSVDGDACADGPESSDGDVVGGDPGGASAATSVDDSVCDDVSGCDVSVSASATAGLLAIATPRPSAIASAPTRPMYLAQPVLAAGAR
jgi:hypothetical protein